MILSCRQANGHGFSVPDGWNRSKEVTHLSCRLTVDLEDYIATFELVRIVCGPTDCCVFDSHTTQQDSNLEGSNKEKSHHKCSVILEKVLDANQRNKPLAESL